MKNMGTILAAIFVAVVLLCYMCTFQVRFTEMAIIKTWGRPAQEAIVEPGLKFKWPPPIQTVVNYDKRTRILENRTEETRTVDGKNLVLTTFALWKINDPALFHTNFPAGVDEGERKLRTAMVAHKHAVVGRRRFDEFVSTNPDDRRLREIETEIQGLVGRDARNEFGIEIVDFGIKKLGLPESVTTSTFESMKSHEEAKAARYRAEGEARAADILGDARAAEARILAVAREKVAEIESEAQRVVSDYYQEFNEHPELRIFLDTLRTVAQALRTNTTLIITTDERPWNVFDARAREQMFQEGGLQDVAAEPSETSDRPVTARP